MKFLANSKFRMINEGKQKITELDFLSKRRWTEALKRDAAWFTKCSAAIPHR